MFLSPHPPRALKRHAQADLVCHHQTQPFPDGSRLVTIAPPAALDEYINIIDDDGDGGGNGDIPEFQADAGAEPKHKYVNMTNNVTKRREPQKDLKSPSKKRYTNIGPDADHFRLSSGIGEDGHLTTTKGYVNASPGGQPLAGGMSLVPETAPTAPNGASVLPPLPPLPPSGPKNSKTPKKRYINVDNVETGTRL